MDAFLESMNELFKGVRFTEVFEADEAQATYIEVKTISGKYGMIRLDYGQFILPPSKRQLIFDAVDMLSILLENRTRQERLALEKDHLKKEWIKQTENCQELDEQYKTLSENSEDMILRFDSSYNIVYGNKCTEKMFDLCRALFISKNICELNLPADQNEFWIRNLEKVFSLEISVSENLVLHLNQKKQHYHVKFVPEKDKDENINYVLATARDITDLKSTEKQLFESQWHLKQAQRIAMTGSWVWHMKYDKIVFSDELCHILGLELHDNEHHVSDLKKFINRKRFLLIKSFQENPDNNLKNFEVEISIKTAYNERRHCVIRGETILGKNGEIKKLHGTLQDITERKLMERELKCAKQKAEESDRLKSAFLANMSHEIRTPLNGILGFSELLRKKNITTEKRQFYVDIICSNGKQLLGVISDIIDISRIESGQITIEKDYCSLPGMFNDLYDYLKNDLQAKGKSEIKPVVIPDPLQPDLSLFCDEIHLKQIMNNLLSNAIKFTQEGEIKFGYEVKGTTVEFFVIDTGIGIKQEYHHVIFERFRQANESPSREHGGTGLGLAICKNLVKLMGGNIWLISKKGCGSEFRFSLPFISNMKTNDVAITNNVSIEYAWPGKKILIVEDDMPSAQLLKESLTDTYALIFHADDGEKALFMNETIRPDIILMDVRLPKMSGIQVIQTIRKKDKALPIIAITAHAFSEDKALCTAAGANEYISKPLDQAELFLKIAQFIKGPTKSISAVKIEELRKS
ncbi:MAG TPA: ATP-binding protein [Bacteroidales bacterium]|nr:ATP-binding protein [Bacteroidales bacterium]